MINGINLNDMVQNQITFQPPISTVQEFRVDNSTMSAEYGRKAGTSSSSSRRPTRPGRPARDATSGRQRHPSTSISTPAT